MKTIALILLTFLTTITARATTYYWVSGSAGIWSNAANWSTTLGGAGGAGIPGIGDDVVFNAAAFDKNGNCTLTGDVNVNSITVTSYSGTIDLGAYSLTYTNCSLGSGTLTGTGSLHALAGGTSQFRGMAVNCAVDGTQSSFSASGINGVGSISLKVTTSISISEATFNGAVYLEFSGSVTSIVNGTTFNQSLTLVNTSGLNIDLSNNTYKQPVILSHRGAALVGFTSYDDEIFESDLTVRIHNDKQIYLGNTGTPRYANIIVDTAATGSQINMGFTGGIATISGTITYTQTSASSLDLRNCIFDADPQITNTGLHFLSYSSTYNNGLHVSAGTIDIDNNNIAGISSIRTMIGGITNTIFADGAALTVTLDSGSTLDFTLSGNTYGGPTTIIRKAEASITESGTEVFKDNLTVIDSSTNNSKRILLQGTIAFQGNVSLINANSNNTTIQIGGAGKITTLSAGKTITLADVGAYSISALRQTGTDSVNWVLGVASLQVTNGIFNGPVKWSAPTLNVSGNTFNNTAHIAYTGTGTSTNGNNTFNSTAQITCNGTGTFRFGNVADTYNDQVTFTALQGTLQPTYNATSSFKNNMTVESTGGAQVVFGVGANGRAQFNGTGNQSITMSGTTTPIFNRVTINKTAGTFTFNLPLTVGVNMTFTNGIVTATSATPVVFNNGATTSGASSLSFIDGPVRKIGNQAFTFPVGDDGVFRSIAMSAPSATTDAFTAEFIRGSHGHTDPATYGTGVVTVGSCEYWTLDRTTGSAGVNVTLGWNTADCSLTITDPTKLAVARWDGAQWVNHGNGGTTGNTSLGTVTTSAAVTGFSPFALASTDIMNPLPIELLSFEATLAGDAVALNWATATEHNSSYFIVERSADLQSFEGIGEVTAAGNSTRVQAYTMHDQQPLSGLSYYRLKQVDVDGSVTYYRPVSIEMNVDLAVFPNPSNADFHLNAKRDITILDSQGQVCQQLISADKIDLSGRAAGVYILVTTHGERLKLMKIN